MGTNEVQTGVENQKGHSDFAKIKKPYNSLVNKAMNIICRSKLVAKQLPTSHAESIIYYWRYKFGKGFNNDLQGAHPMW
jgi:hypothetical protein